MGQDPSTIRHELEQTRERMGETVEALAYKADVPSRAKENVQGKVDAVRQKVTGVAHRADEATPSTDDVRDGAQRAVGIAQENPLGLAIGAVAVGFVGGLLLPVTRTERERLGPIGDQVRDVADTAVEHGRQAVQEVAEQAGEAAKDAADTVREAAKDVADQTAEAAKETGAEHAQRVQEDANRHVRA